MKPGIRKVLFAILAPLRETCFLFPRIPRHPPKGIDQILGNLPSQDLCAKPHTESARLPAAHPRGCTIVNSRGNCPKSDVVTPDQGRFVPGRQSPSFTFNPLGW